MTTDTHKYIDGEREPGLQTYIRNATDSSSASVASDSPNQSNETRAVKRKTLLDVRSSLLSARSDLWDFEFSGIPFTKARQAEIKKAINHVTHAINNLA